MTASPLVVSGFAFAALLAPQPLARPALIATSPLRAPATMHGAKSTDAADVDRAFTRGREALNAGRFDDAMTLLEEVRKARPTDAAGLLLLARARCGAAELLAQQGEESAANAEETFARAEEAARAAIETDGRSAAAWSTLGHVLTRAGKFSEAVDTLYHAEKLDRPTPELLLDLCDALLMARDFALENEDQGAASARFADAEAALERASQLFEVQVDVLRRSAELHTLKGENRLAARDYRRAIQLRPGDASLHEAHLKVIEATQSFSEASDFLTGLVDEPALAHWYRSRVFELRGNLDFNKTKDYAAAAANYLKAEQDFRECAKQDDRLAAAVTAYLPTLRAYRGRALTLAEKFADAEAALFSAIDLDRTNENALLFLHKLQDAMWTKFGGEGRTKEQWDEIRGFASKLSMVEPGNAENWNNWGFFARDAGKYEESYLAYRRAIELEPKNARYLNDTALILLYHLGRDFDRAQEWLTQAIAIADAARHEPDRPANVRQDDETTLGDAYGNLINLLQQTDRKEQAIARLRELEQKLPKASAVDTWKRTLLPDEWKEEQDAKAAARDAAAEKAKKAAGTDGKDEKATEGDGSKGDGSAEEGSEDDGSDKGAFKKTGDAELDQLLDEIQKAADAEGTEDGGEG